MYAYSPEIEVRDNDRYMLDIISKLLYVFLETTPILIIPQQKAKRLRIHAYCSNVSEEDVIEALDKTWMLTKSMLGQFDIIYDNIIKDLQYEHNTYGPGNLRNNVIGINFNFSKLTGKQKNEIDGLITLLSKK